MRVGHLVILTITLMSMGMVVLPSAVSLFAGEHYFYNIDEGYGSKCIKCHADIYEELKNSANHSRVDGSNGFSGEECTACHRSNTSVTYASGETNSPGKEAHAATITNCGYCHFNSSNPFNAPVAGGFGQSDLPDDTGVNESHYKFVTESRSSDLLLNESESCIACHTTCEVRFNFNVSVESTVVVNNTYSGWEFQSMELSNFTTYTEVKS
ncbi:MAG TPA: hypothetical protein EYP30_07065 [Archaeoglobaceae archaeon]|nr:hypothetical protein [Archaeoglobaceae archaeon]